MQLVPGFWVGALTVGRAFDVAALAAVVGGCRPLVDGGVDALVAAGVPETVARPWVASPSVPTRGQVITRMDARYPPRLAEIPEAPAALFVEGDPAVLSRSGWGVVGTRACTAYGAGVARHLANRLVAAGKVVVSGLARGIDGHAHRAALDAGGATTAVLGHGLSFTAPPSHRALRERIIAQGGAVVTAFLDEHPPHAGTFPARNAWISGLSDGVVVVEAPARSGARITARLAASHGREVFAVPGPVRAPASVGCLELIAEGAGVVVDVDRFADEVLGGKPPTPEDWLADVFAGVTLDEAASRAGRSVSSLLAELSLREAKGEVRRLPGQRYAPASPVP
jgi:DNA processing protein